MPTQYLRLKPFPHPFKVIKTIDANNIACFRFLVKRLFSRFLALYSGDHSLGEFMDLCVKTKEWTRIGSVRPSMMTSNR